MFQARPFRAATVGLTLAAVFASQGCSAFQPKTQNVTITTPTPGAMISVDGENKGPSPVSVALRRNQEHSIIARAAGGGTGTYNLGTRISTTGVLDIVGTVIFIVPVIGVFTPGFKELDRTTVVVQTGGASSDRAVATTD